jgi:hypothetical protein
LTRSMVGLALTLTLAGAASAFAAGGAGGGGGGGGTGVAKPPAANCTAILSMTAEAVQVPGSMSINTTYAVDPCTKKNNVVVTVTNVATNAVEYSGMLHASLGTIVYQLPLFATTYDVKLDVVAFTGGALFDTRTIRVTTPPFVSGCVSLLPLNTSVGYFGTTPAIWTKYDTTGCLTGRERIQMTFTNLDNGFVYPSYALGTTGLLDFEGSQVPYSTHIGIHAELYDAGGHLADAQDSQVLTPAAP